MLKTAIKIGFNEKDPNTGKLTKVQDAFVYHEPASFDEMLVDADKSVILDYYNAHRRVVCANSGGRDYYVAYKTGHATLEELQAFVSSWKPGMTYANARGSKAEKIAQKALFNPEALAIIARQLGITVEMLQKMRKTAMMLDMDIPQTENEIAEDSLLIDTAIAVSDGLLK